MQLIGSRLKSELPKIRIRWGRGRDPFDWTKAMIYLILGKRGAGKSALVESIGLRYPKIIDLFGSRDNENLAWCREKSLIDDILLVHGDNVSLDCSWDTCNVNQFNYDKIRDYEAIITCDYFYSSQNNRFLSLQKIIDNFWGRYEWSKPIYVAIREASSFLYSRIKLEGVNMKMAKHDFIYFQREMRHFGYSLGIDTIRWTSIDKEMRDLADYLILKKVGAQGLPSDINWLYKFVEPMSMAALHPKYFLTLTSNASVGYGMFELPPFHKEEGVDLVKELGIVRTIGEEIEESTIQRVGDREHVEIIELYNKNQPMATIAKLIKRSSYTVHKHIKDHNRAIEKSGICKYCERAGSDLMDVELHIGS